LGVEKNISEPGEKGDRTGVAEHVQNGYETNAGRRVWTDVLFLRQKDQRQLEAGGGDGTIANGQKDKPRTRTLGKAGVEGLGRLQPT